MQFLPIQPIYQGTTDHGSQTMDHGLPKDVEFSDDSNVTNAANHWSNESKSIQHLQMMLFPNV